MKLLRFALIVVTFALLGSAVTAEAKVRKRRNTSRNQRTMQHNNKSAKAQKCGLDMVQYSWQGMMMYPVSDVSVERKAGKVVMTVRGTVGDEKEFVLADGEQLLKAALEIINRERMLDYGVSYQLNSEFQVLDGYSWSFSARLADGRKVSSHGSNAEPDGDGLASIQDLLFGRARKELGIE